MQTTFTLTPKGHAALNHMMNELYFAADANALARYILKSLEAGPKTKYVILDDALSTDILEDVTAEKFNDVFRQVSQRGWTHTT